MLCMDPQVRLITHRELLKHSEHDMQTQRAAHYLPNCAIENLYGCAVFKRVWANLSEVFNAFISQIDLRKPSKGQTEAVVQNQEDQCKCLRAPALLVSRLLGLLLEECCVLEPLRTEHSEEKEEHWPNEHRVGNEPTRRSKHVEIVARMQLLVKLV